MFLLFLILLSLLPLWVLYQGLVAVLGKSPLELIGGGLSLPALVPLFAVLGLVYSVIASIIWFGWVAPRLPLGLTLLALPYFLLVVHAASMTAVYVGQATGAEGASSGPLPRALSMQLLAFLLTAGAGALAAAACAVASQFFAFGGPA
jgi:hypothetical protein